MPPDCWRGTSANAAIGIGRHFDRRRCAAVRGRSLAERTFAAGVRRFQHVGGRPLRHADGLDASDGTNSLPTRKKSGTRRTIWSRSGSQLIAPSPSAASWRTGRLLSRAGERSEERFGIVARDGEAGLDRQTRGARPASTVASTLGDSQDRSANRVIARRAGERAASACGLFRRQRFHKLLDRRAVGLREQHVERDRRRALRRSRSIRSRSCARPRPLPVPRQRLRVDVDDAHRESGS